MKRIVIVGSGISGLSSAYFLKNHKIIIIEKNNYLGGHTHTHTYQDHKKKIKFDSGFIVFNNKNYPNFLKLLKQLKVEYENTDMSFSVSNNKINYEWSGKSLKTIFDFRNLFSIRYIKVLIDIFRFSFLSKKIDEKLTVYHFLLKNNFSTEFQRLYFYPMCASIWSSPKSKIEKYNASFIINFFKNHGLTNILFKRPIWYFVKNGSSSYIKKIINKINYLKIFMNEEVKFLNKSKKYVLTKSNKKINYDHLIFANHTDEIKKILKNKNKNQRNLLDSVRYSSNKVIIHHDQRFMPRLRLNWSSWNFFYDKTKIVLTYWMNLLQNLKINKNIFVTLNHNKIDKDKIIKTITYHHPVFRMSYEKIQALFKSAQGFDNIWFTGAWTGYGFHEDGVKSSLYISKIINEK